MVTGATRAGAIGRLALATAILAVVCGSAVAAPTPVTLVPDSFAGLGGGSAASAMITSDYSYGTTFTGHLISQAFNLASGKYLYLYQADNDGPSSLEVFGVAPFYGLAGAGYLTSGEPALFLSGGNVPAGASYDSALAEPGMSFAYPGYLGLYVPAGNHTRVQYMISPYAPTVGDAFVIDTGVARGDVVTPMPEPATIALLGIGGVLMTLVRRRRRH